MPLTLQTGRRARIATGKAALLVAAAGVLGGVLLFLLVVNLIGSGKARSTVGTDLYALGNAKSLAGSVARQGPLLLQDPLGKGRDVYVQHLAGDDWRTFDAHPPGEPAHCLVTWRRAAQAFVDGCSDRTFPPDGTGLSSFPTRVDDKGRVLVDLRNPRPPESPVTTTLPAPPAP